MNWRTEYLNRALDAVDDASGALTGIDYFRLNFDPQGHVLGGGAPGSAEQNLDQHAANGNLRRYITLVNDVVNPGAPSKLKDPAIVHALLTDADRRWALIQSLRDIVVNGNYDGLDLDFENLYASDRALFSAFVLGLADELHAQARRLVVTVQPQTRPETRDGPGAQDLAAIASHADDVRVMAYHVHYSGTAPGPSTPRAWLESLIEYNLTLVPAEKLSMAFYAGGWHWTGTSAVQLNYADAVNLAQQLGATLRWSATDAVPMFRASSGSSPVEVWFENACSLLEKRRLAARHGLRGIALWHLGKEDPGVYAALRADACIQDLPVL